MFVSQRVHNTDVRMSIKHMSFLQKSPTKETYYVAQGVQSTSGQIALSQQGAVGSELSFLGSSLQSPPWARITEKKS